MSSGDVQHATSARIFAGPHRVSVVAGGVGEFRMEGDAAVSGDRERLTVEDVRGRIVVRVPAGSDLVIGTTSGRVSVAGPVGEVAVTTDSGRVEIERAVSVDVRTGSSRIEVGRVEARCAVHTVSGRVEVASCGAADVSSRSGRVSVSGVRGAVRAHAVSGKVTVSLDEPMDVVAETVSGRVEVSLPAGTVAHEPAPGEEDRPRPPDCDCTVVARSVSGRVEVAVRDG